MDSQNKAESGDPEAAAAEYLLVAESGQGNGLGASSKPVGPALTTASTAHAVLNRADKRPLKFLCAHGSKALAAPALQTAAGVSLQCDEGADFKNFRVGLSVLERLGHVERTVAHHDRALTTTVAARAPQMAQAA